MRMIRCDVKGCKNEYEESTHHPLGRAPPGWRHESSTEVKLVPADSLQLPPGMVPPPGMPEQVEMPVYIEADICPDHPRGYELREGPVPRPMGRACLIAAA